MSKTLNIEYYSRVSFLAALRNKSFSLEVPNHLTFTGTAIYHDSFCLMSPNKDETRTQVVTCPEQEV